MSGSKLSEEGKTRLETMVKSNDGFDIAEVDLRLRGPGNLMGTQQSGILKLKIADIIKDNTLLKVARDTANEIIKQDPNLERSENQVIKRTLSVLSFDSNIWNFIS
jgi:ATP-dependent DNA helicase RecG